MKRYLCSRGGPGSARGRKRTSNGPTELLFHHARRARLVQHRVPSGSTPRAKSWDLTTMLPSIPTASCSIKAATPRSTCPACPIPMPTGSTPRAKSWDATDAAGSHGFLLDQGSYTTLDVPGSIDLCLTGSTPRAKSWEVTTMLPATIPTASCSIMATTPRSTCPVARRILFALRDQRLGPNRGILLPMRLAPTASCSIRAATPHSMCPARPQYLCHRDQRLRPNRGIATTMLPKYPRLPARSGQLHHARRARLDLVPKPTG